MTRSNWAEVLWESESLQLQDGIQPKEKRANINHKMWPKLCCCCCTNSNHNYPRYLYILLYFQPDYQDNQVKTIICHFALFIWSQVTVAAAKLGIPHMLSPSYTFQFLLWDPEFLPGQMKHIISPVGSGSTLKFPPSMACLKNLQVDIQESFGQEGTATLLRAPPRCLSPGTLQGNPFDLVLLVSAQLTGLAEADLP